jgi:hypothetical protein
MIRLRLKLSARWPAHRDHFREADESERKRRFRPLVKFPADGHGEHLLAEDGEQPAGEVKPEIADLENGVGAFIGGFFNRRGGRIFWWFLIVHETAAHNLAEFFRGSSFHLGSQS